MHTHRPTRRTTAVALATGALVVAGVLAGSAAGADDESAHKVTLCHATHSRSNPYVVVTVDDSSVLHEGHGGHEGPVFSTDLPKHTRWGDIIPAFDHGPDATYAGMNLDSGQELLDSGCTASVNPTTTEPLPT